MLNIFYVIVIISFVPLILFFILDIDSKHILFFLTYTSKNTLI